MPEVKNFCPKTGVGRFNAKLEPNQLKIKIKLHIKTALDTLQRGGFVGLFEPLVRQHWENQYGFQCSKGAYPGVYKPIFEIKYTDEMMNSHFVLNLLDGAGGNELVARDVYYKATNEAGFKPTSANLFTGSVHPTNSSGDLLRDLKKSFPFYVDMQGNNPSTHATSQLNSLAKQLAGVDANVSVRVTAYGANRGQKRTAVMAILTNNGLANVTARNSKKSIFTTSRSKATGSTSYVKVSLANGLDTTTFDPTTKPLFTYPAAAIHEFGHMLGLMDEYACLSKKASDKMLEFNFIDAAEQDQWESFNPQGQLDTTVAARVADGQRKFIKYCAKARVDPPHYGQHSISVMSSGSEFKPCHFVTLWAAIVEMTQGNTTENDWSIVKI